MPKLKKGLIMPTPEEDAAINAGIAADPDTYELGEQEFKQLRKVGRPRPKRKSSSRSATIRRSWTRSSPAGLAGSPG